MIKEDVSDIADKIIYDELSRAQVFTQMRQLINSLEKENEYRAKIINDRDGVIKEQREDLIKVISLLKSLTLDNLIISIGEAEEIEAKHIKEVIDE